MKDLASHTRLSPEQRESRINSLISNIRELWSVEIPLRQLMIVGIDCYHNTAAGKRSIGALVASLNQGMSSDVNRVAYKMMSSLQHSILKLFVFLAALKAYLKYNNSLPSRIIVYRDGVGDGMLRSVVDYEVPQIMQSIKTMGQDYEFFARIDGKIANPPPGTVIDTEVTRPEWYDFFIVSQAVRFGCVAPTHYNVVFDSSGLKPDHMQRLAYKHVLQLAGNNQCRSLHQYHTTVNSL
uniref:Piwi domain-containing protein n=1 Tax=Sinocyclocheilus anshuiensis TaxID=1608454 RepID=A0A671RIU9_9TELE